MREIDVHPRVSQRHPEITDNDVLFAWHSRIALVIRETSVKDFYVSVGFDQRGRAIEMVAAEEEDGSLLVFHAMTPPGNKTLLETGITGGAR